MSRKDSRYPPPKTASKNLPQPPKPPASKPPAPIPPSARPGQPDESPAIGLAGDQRRALHAYRSIAQVTDPEAYKTTINDLGATIRRSGLVAAMARLERSGPVGMVVRDHLASAGVPGLEGATQDTLPAEVRALPVEDYMHATRELLRVAAWLKRAAQASFEGK